MNLPNKLTIMRVCLIPVFLVCMLTPLGEGNGKWIAFSVFLIASITDFLDGYIARRDNLVTNFGKFMDPIADKLLVCSAMFCFVALNRPGKWFVWVAIVIMAREFTISGFRVVAADNGVVIAASKWGKIKTVFQIIMSCMLIANLDYEWYRMLTVIVVIIATILTIVSLIDYMIKNINVIKM